MLVDAGYATPVRCAGSGPTRGAMPLDPGHRGTGRSFRGTPASPACQENRSPAWSRSAAVTTTAQAAPAPTPATHHSQPAWRPWGVGLVPAPLPQLDAPDTGPGPRSGRSPGSPSTPADPADARSPEPPPHARAPGKSPLAPPSTGSVSPAHPARYRSHHQHQRTTADRTHPTHPPHTRHDSQPTPTGSLPRTAPAHPAATATDPSQHPPRQKDVATTPRIRRPQVPHYQQAPTKSGLDLHERSIRAGAIRQGAPSAPRVPGRRARPSAVRS